MKASGGIGTRWMTGLINNIVKEGCIPHDWRGSVLCACKGKGDPLVCDSYRPIKLTEQPMKVLERVLEKRVGCQLITCSLASCLVREPLIPCSSCDDDKYKRKTDAGLSESFEVKVGLHQGSVLNPLLFAAVMNEARSGLPSELLYADDLVLMASTMDQLGGRVAEWRVILLGKGLKVNTGKSKVMVGSSGGNISVHCTVYKHWIHKRYSGG